MELLRSVSVLATGPLHPEACSGGGGPTGPRGAESPSPLVCTVEGRQLPVTVGGRTVLGVPFDAKRSSWEAKFSQITMYASCSVQHDLTGGQAAVLKGQLASNNAGFRFCVSLTWGLISWTHAIQTCAVSRVTWWLGIRVRGGAAWLYVDLDGAGGQRHPCCVRVSCDCLVPLP